MNPTPIIELSSFPEFAIVIFGNDTIEPLTILSNITFFQRVAGENWYSGQTWIETETSLVRSKALRFVGDDCEIEDYKALTPLKEYP